MYTYEKHNQHVLDELKNRMGGYGKSFNQQAMDLFKARYQLRIARLALVTLSITLATVTYLWWANMPPEAISVCQL